MGVYINVNTKHENDADLVQQTCRGDTKAFEQLVIKYDRQVMKLAFNMTGHPVDAQDICQDTFLRAYSKLSTFRGESSFRTWLMRIAVNQSLNHRRRKDVGRLLSLDFLRERDGSVWEKQISAETRNLDEGIEDAAVLDERIQTALLDLSERERAVFVLKHEYGFRIKEIAVMLNCAQGTVKNYLFRAVQKLKKLLIEV